KDHYEAWAENPFPTGQWLHFAAVYDGSWFRVYLDGEQIQAVETKGGTINLSMAYNGKNWEDCFSIGRSAGYARYFNGCVSECRVWNVARTQAELQDGICYVDPTSEGLVAYWRFNGELQDDGTVLDETGHGYNASIFGNIQWRENNKCPW
ncbi:MAG: LamG domain-containing protein, partial [Prevotella sp.]|nr:LamG domain-containing protein [Prevotella sp.]